MCPGVIIGACLWHKGCDRCFWALTFSPEAAAKSRHWSAILITSWHQSHSFTRAEGLHCHVSLAKLSNMMGTTIVALIWPQLSFPANLCVSHVILCVGGVLLKIHQSNDIMRCQPQHFIHKTNIEDKNHYRKSPMLQLGQEMNVAKYLLQ